MLMVNLVHSKWNQLLAELARWKTITREWNVSALST